MQPFLTLPSRKSLSSSFNNLLYASKVGKTKSAETATIIKKHKWIASKKVEAHKLTEDKIIDLMERELEMIRVEEIDNVSSIINNEFNSIFNIEE